MWSVLHRTREGAANAKRWLLLVGLVAALFTVFIVRAAHSDTGSLTIEAESLTIAAGSDTHVFSDATASGGKALAFPSNDTVTGSVTTTAPTTTITLTARGDQCNGAPIAQVFVDGAKLLSPSVSATTWTAYSATVNIPAGTHSLAVTYPNDAYVKGTCDRNLRADKLTFVYGSGGGTTDTTPPAAPSGLNATAGDSSVALKWTANTESDLAGYNVYRSTTNGGPYSKINSSLLTSPSYSDTGLTNGTTYYYVVKASDTSNNLSNPSAQAQATPAAAGGGGGGSVASFEAESMTIDPTSDTHVFSDGTASGGQAVSFPGNDTITKTVTTPAAGTVTVAARGDQCNGAPNMVVTVDGRTAMSVGVASTSWSNYSGNLSISAGSHSFAVSYTNDVRVAGVCDRNLRVDKVSVGGTSGGTPTPLLPDLVQEPPSQLGVVQSSASWRLGFDSGVHNQGAGPLMVNGHRPDTTSTMVADQAIKMSDGTTETIPNIGTMIFYVPHNHWHYVGFDKYELHKASDYSFVAPDQKSGFCLGDRYTFANGVRTEPPLVNGPYTFNNCQPGNTAALNVNEGISVGYGDDYSPQLEGQYIDVTGVAPGQYVVVHRVNSDHSLQESDYTNDAASVLINLWPNGYGVAPYLTVLATCPTSDHCSQATTAKVSRHAMFRPTYPANKPYFNPSLVDPPLLVPRSARFFAVQSLHKSLHARVMRLRCVRVARTRFNCAVTAKVRRVTYRGTIQVWLPPRDGQHWWGFRVRLAARGHTTINRTVNRAR